MSIRTILNMIEVVFKYVMDFGVIFKFLCFKGVWLIPFTELGRSRECHSWMCLCWNNKRYSYIKEANQVIVPRKALFHEWHSWISQLRQCSSRETSKLNGSVLFQKKKNIIEAKINTPLHQKFVRFCGIYIHSTEWQ